MNAQLEDIEFSRRPLATEEKIKSKMAEAVTKAVDSLGRYKFLMFGYHAAQWVTLNKLLDKPEPNPFKGFVKLARMTKDAKVTSDVWAIGPTSSFKKEEW